MALKDAFKRINNKLKDTFHHRPYDPAPARARVVRGLEQAKSQYEAGRTRVPNRMWSTGHEAVEFVLRIGDEVIPLNGENANTLAPQDFVPFLNELAEAVRAGDLDNEIKTALGDEGATAPARVSVKPAPRTRSAGVGQGRSAPRQSNLPARKDGLAHRVPYLGGSPHPSYKANKNKTYWRSPEQVDEDTRVSNKKKAAHAGK